MTFGWEHGASLGLSCPPWCSILGATVTAHEFFCILHFTAIVCTVIYIQHQSIDFKPRHGIWQPVYCDLDLWNMTLGWGQDTPLGHRQPLCKILSRSHIAIWGSDPDTDYDYVCNVNLTWRYDLESRSWLAHGSGTTIVWNVFISMCLRQFGMNEKFKSK